VLLLGEELSEPDVEVGEIVNVSIIVTKKVVAWVVVRVS